MMTSAQYGVHGVQTKYPYANTEKAVTLALYSQRKHIYDCILTIMIAIGIATPFSGDVEII